MALLMAHISKTQPSFNDRFQTLWRFMFPFTEKLSILYWGCELETLESFLSMNADQIVFLTSYLEKAKRLSGRKNDEDRRTKLSFICGSLLPSPFCNSSFDLIIVDLAEEAFEGNAQPEVSKHLLDDIYCLLKNNGHLLLNVKTRWNSRIHKTLQRCILQSGLKETQTFFAFPSFKNTKFIISSENKSVYRFLFKHLIKSRYYLLPVVLRLLTKVIMPSFWLYSLRLFYPRLTLLVRKGV